MKTETPLPVDSANTERPTHRSTVDGVHVRTSNLSPTRLVETSSHLPPSLVLLAPPITLAQHATFHYYPTSESNADSSMTVSEDTHTTHETRQRIDASTTLAYLTVLSTSEHTAVTVEVGADV